MTSIATLTASRLFEAPLLILLAGFAAAFAMTFVLTLILVLVGFIKV